MGELGMAETSEEMVRVIPIYSKCSQCFAEGRFIGASRGSNIEGMDDTGRESVGTGPFIWSTAEVPNQIEIHS